MLELRDLVASYPGKGRVLEGVSITVPEGRTECVLGPSGCGKTTLLMIACGLKAADSGTALLDGSPVVSGDLRIGLILQHYGLFPWFTASDNAGLGLRVRGVPRRERHATVSALLARIGLADNADRFPSQMSGGEQQRVAIARGLSLSPRLLLMDEPFSALDALTRESLQDLLVRLLQEQRLSALIVTHSIEEAAFLGCAISLLAGSPSRIVERFENPGMGSRDFRSSSEYFNLENSIRTAMKDNRLLTNGY